MAGCAGELTLITMIQRKAVYLEPGRRPGLGRVTILATHTKNAGMNCRFSVALHTFCRGGTVNTILVTADALDLAVHPVQRESLPVIKIHHAVNSIMTIQAGCTILINVCGQKLSLLPVARGMAIGTNQRVQNLRILAG